jgi:hypothetical protein
MCEGNARTVDCDSPLKRPNHVKALVVEFEPSVWYSRNEEMSVAQLFEDVGIAQPQVCVVRDHLDVTVHIKWVYGLGHHLVESKILFMLGADFKAIHLKTLIDIRTWKRGCQ